jgi:hypothetical protein
MSYAMTPKASGTPIRNATTATISKTIRNVATASPMTINLPIAWSGETFRNFY